MVICFGYKISPNMMGIQDGYNKKIHIECIEYLMIVLRYEDGDIRVVLVE